MELRILIFLSLVAGSLCQYYECPPNWNALDENCYQFVLYPKLILNSAKAHCQQNGATLASINDDSEHNFIVEWMRNNDVQRNDWYTSGRRDASNTNRFYWEGNGEAVNQFQYWFNDQAKGEVDKDYIYYHTDGVNYGWRLGDGTKPNPFICEIPKKDRYKIVQESRDFSYGSTVIDPKYIMRGPEFTQQPTNVIFDTGSVEPNAVMDCQARGLPQPAYTWYKEVEKRTIEIDPMLDRRFTVSNGRLIINKPDPTIDNSNYYCTTNNKFGSLLSRKAQLSFGYLLDFSKSSRDPVYARAYQGVGIECQPPKHYPTVLYSWYKDSIRNFVRPKQKSYIFISQNGKLYFSSVTKEDAGEYFCMVYNPSKNSRAVSAAEGKHSTPIKLIIQEGIASEREPEIASGFPSVFPNGAKRGDNITLECFAWGTGTMRYNWRRPNNLPLPSGSRVEDHGRILSIPNAQLLDAGNYECTAERVNGLSNTKRVLVSLGAEPFFMQQIGDQHVDEGQELTWRCLADGEPGVTYHWFKDTVELTQASLPQEDQQRITIQNNVLKFSMVDPKDSGMYQCGAENLHGVRYSSGQLRVLSFPPNFAKYPLLPNQYGTVQGNVTIMCRAEGAPRPEIVWFKDGGRLSVSEQPSARVRKLANGWLFINNVQIGDQGIYKCEARNTFGKVSSEGNLTILSTMTISRPPENVIVEMNKTAYIMCEASYNPALDLTYTWSHNGKKIDWKLEKYYHDYYKSGSGYHQGGLYVLSAKTFLGGTYTCHAETTQHEVTASAALTVIGPPSEAGGVKGSQVTVSSILLKWTRSADNGRPIISFVIEGYNKNRKRWEVVKTNVKGTKLSDDQYQDTVTGLSPWTSYIFRVRGENELGTGEPSKPSPEYQTSPSLPVKEPPNVRGGGGKVGDLVMEWDVLEMPDWNGPGIGYVVYWRKKGGSEQDWEKRNKTGQATRHVSLVGSRLFYREYEVKVQAYNQVGGGPNSSVVMVWSAMDLPIAVPTNVRADPHNATALMVTWNPVPDTRTNFKGVLGGYRIYYWKEDDETEEMALYNIIPGQTGEALIIGLASHLYYAVNVMVYNDAGTGPKSTNFFMETLRSAPLNAPTEVWIEQIGYGAIRAHWRGVSTDQEEEPLQGYKVELWLRGENVYKAVHYDGGKEDEVEIYGLMPDVMYMARVLGYSRGGDGKKSWPTTEFIMAKDCKTREDQPDKHYFYLCGCSGLTVSYLSLLAAALSHLLLKLF